VKFTWKSYFRSFRASLVSSKKKLRIGGEDNSNMGRTAATPSTGTYGPTQFDKTTHGDKNK